MRMINGMVVINEEESLGLITHAANGKPLPKPEHRTAERMIAWFEEAIEEVKNLPEDGEVESLFRQILLGQYRDKLLLWRHDGSEVPPSFEVH